jgi:hypothetical protein
MHGSVARGFYFDCVSDCAVKDWVIPDTEETKFLLSNMAGLKNPEHAASLIVGGHNAISRKQMVHG